MPLPSILRTASAGAERLVDRILCVVGAILFSQAPEFLQQYLQRLEGHLDEARLQVARLSDAAARSGSSLASLADQAGRSADPATSALGTMVKGTLARAAQLNVADAALRGASAWSRPFAFLAHADWGIAWDTWRAFRPAVPTTAEGMTYAAAGIVAVLVLYHLCIRPSLVRLARNRTSPSTPG